MESNNFKVSISRKSIHKLSKKQQNRVLCEIRRNLRLQNSPVCRTVDRISDENYRQDIPDSLSIEYINSSCHLTNDNFDVRRDVYMR